MQWAEVLIQHQEMIKDSFGVCLVSITGEHQRDYRELGVLKRNFISRSCLGG